jgi:hypothetical protein
MRWTKVTFSAVRFLFCAAGCDDRVKETREKWGIGS